jgi:thiopeptide-type bacteriocin biosynthesis protein
MKWLSAHIFYHHNQDILLNDCITPLLEELNRTYNLNAYFFIRYWECGPHIRLRLRIDNSAEMSTIKNVLTERINRYISEHPSLSINTQNLQETFDKMHQIEKIPTPLTHNIYNNCIKFIDYHPEFSRYGGHEGIKIAEDFFCYSSKIALKLMNQKQNQRNGLVIQMIIIMLRAFGYNTHKSANFLIQYANYWRQYSQIPHTPNLSAANYRIVKQNIQHAMQSSNSTLNYWHLNMQHYHEKLLKIPFYVTHDGSLDSALFSYMHLHNNRMGLTPRDEFKISSYITACLQSQPE